MSGGVLSVESNAWSDGANHYREKSMPEKNKPIVDVIVQGPHGSGFLLIAGLLADTLDILHQQSTADIPMDRRAELDVSFAATDPQPPPGISAYKLGKACVLGGMPAVRITALADSGRGPYPPWQQSLDAVLDMVVTDATKHPNITVIEAVEMIRTKMGAIFR